MKCVLCLYTREGEADDAITVVRGYATCERHMPYVASGQEWIAILTTVLREEEDRSRRERGYGGANRPKRRG